MIQYDTIRYDMIYIYLTAIGLTPGGSRTAHIYTQYRGRNIHKENGRYIMP
jgi:hypothetical protein